jgi:aspartate/tyrosine/aromatic aminotransferase
MFEKLEMAPPDAILGLTEAFLNDPNPNKINLGVGVYKDADGQTPVLATVKAAEKRVLEQEKTKNYLPMNGTAEYGAAVRGLVFGEGHEFVSNGRAVTAHTPGGTGALRVAGDFIKRMFPGSRVWLSDPTWANHPNVFNAAGIETASYPYYDQAAKDLAFDAMVASLKQVPAGDFVLLHACCHNPSGMDPTVAQWKQLARLAEESGWIPLFDFAYQGLGDGLEEDALGLRSFLRSGRELLVCSSFSKNFGLYNERVGALTVVAASSDGAEKALSHIKNCVRANFSNPPAHGAAVVTTVLNDAQLRVQWEGEVGAMRDRINGMRRVFVDRLKAKGVTQDFSFLTRQRGMFSFSGLSKEQVQALRDKYAVYVVGSGRINVAGMTKHNMDTLCGAMAAVLAPGA